MKWMITLFAAAVLCAGSAFAADPAGAAGGAGTEEQTDHAAHAGHADSAPDAAAPAAGQEEQGGHTGHSSHAMHDMKGCMEMGDKKCMEMGGKECNCCKDCMKGDGKQCDHHKGGRHKSSDACDTMKGAAKPVKKKPAANKPAEKKPDGKGDAAKPAAMAIEPVPSEAEGRALAQKSNCFACHSIDKKVVGPAWKDVAAKYRDDAGAEGRLIARVSKGSSGAWGSVPMPANSPAVKDADIKALVKFILSLK